MSKPVKRFRNGTIIHREDKAPIAYLHCSPTNDGRFTTYDSVRTSRVMEVTYNEDGTPSRVVTLNSIYVQVKE